MTDKEMQPRDLTQAAFKEEITNSKTLRRDLGIMREKGGPMWLKIPCGRESGWEKRAGSHRA